MKDFCIRGLTRQRISLNEVTAFMTEYLELKKKDFKQQDLQILMQLLQNGMIDLESAIKEYCKEKKYTINTLYNNSQIIKVWIDEDKTD